MNTKKKFDYKKNKAEHIKKLSMLVCLVVLSLTLPTSQFPMVKIQSIPTYKDSRWQQLPDIAIGDHRLQV